jgi:mannose-1-phosphate guanylyltransferase/mannose-1-phosphate guanylyltransferase/mannose-6-phosphate isomerase
MAADQEPAKSPAAASARIYPVILSGGSGTRLWPMSRAAYPKQLLPLIGGPTLLQGSIERVIEADRFEPPLIIANEDHRFIIAEQLREIELPLATIMLEPVARNTAPAAAAAAAWLEAKNPDALMLIMPSDHVITDDEAFLDAVCRGRTAAATGRLVTFGISADRPETGYGYIRLGPELGSSGVHEVAAFVEKPDRARAEGYLAEGGYTWNSGIFLFPVKAYLAELGGRDPETVAAARRAVAEARTDLDFLRLDVEAFAKCRSDSIDYAVMEHTHNAAVVPVSMGWNDLGAWDSVYAATPKDPDGNVVLGDIIAVDCRDSYLRSEEGLVAALGLDGIILVVTADAILIAPKDRAQDVKLLVDQLKRSGRDEAIHQATVHRPWGTYRAIHAGTRVQVKLIIVNPGAKLSLQMHHHRAEHWVVVQGTAKVVRGEEEFVLTESESTYIPLGTKHRLENPGRIPLHLIEVQSGPYLGEDDIVRFSDTYGRS